MILLDGKSVSESRLHRVHQKIEEGVLQHRSRPGLCVIRVGNDPASKIYVTKKIQACQRYGFLSFEKHLPESVSEKEILEEIGHANNNPQISGILVQLPLPKHLNSDRIIEAVSPYKDVDGFHPYNLGCLITKRPSFVACTPLGIMNLLHEYRIDPAGKRAVVIGRSRIVGRPMSLLLDLAGATVTVVHLQTPQPEEICREADILVAAAGSPLLVGKNHVKNGAVVIDVGIHKMSDGRIVGDVDFDNVKSLASAITPVPGGVGPMTICSLLENTYLAFENQTI